MDGSSQNTEVFALSENGGPEGQVSDVPSRSL